MREVARRAGVSIEPMADAVLDLFMSAISRDDAGGRAAALTTSAASAA